jgi:hypothetical protein
MKFKVKEPPKETEETQTHSDRNDASYVTTPAGIVWLKMGAEGPTPVGLTNFGARIVSDVIRDDGLETERFLTIEWTLGPLTQSSSVSVAALSDLGTEAIRVLGPKAIVAIVPMVKDRLKVAVQTLSGDVATTRVYTHTGWRTLDDGTVVYLHGAGALGPAGSVGAVAVELGPPADRYRFHAVPVRRERGVRVETLLGFLDVADPGVTVPLLASVVRAVFPNPDVTLWIAGPTGVGKTELAALTQQCFGSDMDARHLPMAWSSTPNALEEAAFRVKDAVMVVDDYAPQGIGSDAARMRSASERLVRGTGNHSGRGRLNRDASMRPVRAPRCLIIATGEDLPVGHSLRARCVCVELDPTTVDWEQLTAMQSAAADGGFAEAIAGYIMDLAGDLPNRQQRFAKRVTHWRQELEAHGGHKRSVVAIAGLMAALEDLLRYARRVHALTREQSEELTAGAWDTLTTTAKAQGRLQEAADPVRHFVDLIASALVSGRAHVTSRTGEEPQHSRAWGWQPNGGVPTPRGAHIGWVDGDDLYLDPKSAYTIAITSARDENDPIGISDRVLWRRLHESHLLKTTDVARRETRTVRRTLGGRKDRSVLHLAANLFGSLTEPDEPDA